MINRNRQVAQGLVHLLGQLLKLHRPLWPVVDYCDLSTFIREGHPASRYSSTPKPA
jgi:hypothetical protein